MNNIALIAHDNKKPKLTDFLVNRADWIASVDLIGTGRTAKFVKDKGVEIVELKQGREGGYIQMTEMIKKGEIDMLLFFIDPEVEAPYHRDIEKLLEVAINCEIPVALNQTSAELLVLGQIKYEAYKRHKQR